MTATLIVIAKRPVPGRVKTRLVPPLDHAAAAELAAAALSDTLAVVDATPAVHRLLAFDDHADDWLPCAWSHTLQPAGGLDTRLAAAFAAVPCGPALLVGMDTPQLRPELLTAFDPARYDACLGPAPDGGFWAIGFRDPAMAAAAVPGVPMSTDRTGREQHRRLTALGLRVQWLPELVDVDTIDAAHVVAGQAPDTMFAAALTRIEGSAHLAEPMAG